MIYRLFYIIFYELLLPLSFPVQQSIAIGVDLAEAPIFSYKKDIYWTS